MLFDLAQTKAKLCPKDPTARALCPLGPLQFQPAVG